MTYDQLLDGVDHAELNRAEVYPLSWDDQASLEWGVDWFAGLTEYFKAAARDGHAIITWLD